MESNQAREQKRKEHAQKVREERKQMINQRSVVKNKINKNN